VIDLHTHTTASDGRCAPAELVGLAAAAGVDVLSVTDHDTTAAASTAAAACAQAGIEFVPGIEITAVVDGADVHILGYFIDPDSPALGAFLSLQRQRRIDRVKTMIDRLGALGISLDAESILRPAQGNTSKAAGRPWIARALVAAGIVASTGEAFDKYLKRGQPAFVSRVGPLPAEVLAHIHAAGGIGSLAHPGLLERDDLIPAFVAAGLDAIEAYHSKHTAGATARYLDLAARHGLGVSGGSDYHGEPAHDVVGPGGASLPLDLFQSLKGRCATRRATASGSSTSS
jgi:predicted metal-dependent phosphoesterase TrpH